MRGSMPTVPLMITPSAIRRCTMRCRFSSGSSSGPRNSTIRSSACGRSVRRTPSSTVKSPESLLGANPRVGMTAAIIPVRPLRRLRPDWSGT